VLVADADPDTADSLSWLLELHGCRVRIARDQIAVEADARRFQPHLILVDPDTRRGFDVVRRIRSHGCGARIVAHTGWSADEDKERALAAGCDHYLVKPVSPEEFERLLSAIAKEQLVISQ
jgi:DNA-binding response OmpR family regulator